MKLKEITLQIRLRKPDLVTNLVNRHIYIHNQKGKEYLRLDNDVVLQKVWSPNKSKIVLDNIKSTIVLNNLVPHNLLACLG